MSRPPCPLTPSLKHRIVAGLACNSPRVTCCVDYMVPHERLRLRARIPTRRRRRRRCAFIGKLAGASERLFLGRDFWGGLIFGLSLGARLHHPVLQHVIPNPTNPSTQNPTPPSDNKDPRFSFSTVTANLLHFSPTASPTCSHSSYIVQSFMKQYGMKSFQQSQDYFLFNFINIS